MKERTNAHRGIMISLSSRPDSIEARSKEVNDIVAHKAGVFEQEVFFRHLTDPHVMRPGKIGPGLWMDLDELG